MGNFTTYLDQTLQWLMCGFHRKKLTWFNFNWPWILTRFYQSFYTFGILKIIWFSLLFQYKMNFMRLFMFCNILDYFFIYFLLILSHRREQKPAQFFLCINFVFILLLFALHWFRSTTLGGVTYSVCDLVA